MHDPGDVDKMVGQIGPDDLPVLRIMALETAVGGNEPALRRQAIYLLGRFPDVENLGVLFGLAQTREGPHVRTAARNALAATGLSASAPTLKEGLAARDSVEARGAALAIARFAREVGTARARALLLTDEKRPAVVRAITEVVDRLDGRIKQPRHRRRSSNAD